MVTVKTRNGWTVSGELVAESRWQLKIRVSQVEFAGVDCTATATPNMSVNVGDIVSRTDW